jgi:GTP:adenosylcobinamide-phosphate guanylyltransferase
LLPSIYEKLIIKTLRKAQKLAILSALVIASHKKTAAKGKTIIRAKKLEVVAQETGKYIIDVNQAPSPK